MYSILSLCYRAYRWTEQTLPFSLEVFRPHITQVLSLAVFCEFIRGRRFSILFIEIGQSILLIYNLRTLADPCIFRPHKLHHIQNVLTLPCMGLLIIRVIYVLTQLRTHSRPQLIILTSPYPPFFYALIEISPWFCIILATFSGQSSRIGKRPTYFFPSAFPIFEAIASGALWEWYFTFGLFSHLVIFIKVQDVFFIILVILNLNQSIEIS
jgi:hypothetical protein